MSDVNDDPWQCLIVWRNMDAINDSIWPDASFDNLLEPCSGATCSTTTGQCLISDCSRTGTVQHASSSQGSPCHGCPVPAPPTHIHTHSPPLLSRSSSSQLVSSAGRTERFYKRQRILQLRRLRSAQQLLESAKDSFSRPAALNELLQRSPAGESYRCHRRAGAAAAKPPWRPADWGTVRALPELSMVLKSPPHLHPSHFLPSPLRF